MRLRSNKGVSQGSFLPGGIIGEEKTSKLTGVVGRIHFLALVGQKAQLLDDYQLEAIFSS